MKRFGIIGVAGYIAPKHISAIKKTENTLLAAVDPHDNVGYLDSFFPSAAFFTEFERFDRYIDKLRSNNKALDYISVCSPNYIHDTHIKSVLRWGVDAICEKPVVLNPWNINMLEKVERETGKSIWTILQLRLHPKIISLKNKVDNYNSDSKYDIDLNYISARGNWYYASWKGCDEKSGGISTNIGIHLFDMLCWVFGEPKENIVHLNNHDRASGLLVFEKARVRWFLSINEAHLPDEIIKKKKRSYRVMEINKEVINFTDGFSDLHYLEYKNILDNKGHTLEDSKLGVKITHEIRNQKPIGLKGDYHPFAKKKICAHPFNNEL